MPSSKHSKYSGDRALLGIVDDDSKQGEIARRISPANVGSFPLRHTGATFEACLNDFRECLKHLQKAPTSHAVGHFVIVDDTIFQEGDGYPCTIVRVHRNAAHTMLVERDVLLQHLIPLEMGALTPMHNKLPDPHSPVATVKMWEEEQEAPPSLRHMPEKPNAPARRPATTALAGQLPAPAPEAGPSGTGKSASAQQRVSSESRPPVPPPGHGNTPAATGRGRVKKAAGKAQKH